MSAPDRRAKLDRAHGRSVDPPAMRDAGPGAHGRLPQAATGQRRRSGGDASHRRAVHRAAVVRGAADRADAEPRGLSDRPQARAAVDAANGRRGAGAEAARQRPRAGAQDLSLPLARSDDRPAERRRHYNTGRPHGSSGYKPPAPEVFIPALAARAGGFATPTSAAARAVRAQTEVGRGVK